MDALLTFVDDAPVILIGALVVLILLDYLTGLMRALYECKSNSKTHYKGILKKLGIVIGVLVGVVADIILFGGMSVFTDMVTMLFIAGEVLSIIENLGVMGVKLPNAIKSKFTQIQEAESNRKEEELLRQYNIETKRAQEYSVNKGLNDKEVDFYDEENR